MVLVLSSRKYYLWRSSGYSVCLLTPSELGDIPPRKSHLPKQQNPFVTNNGEFLAILMKIECFSTSRGYISKLKCGAVQADFRICVCTYRPLSPSSRGVRSSRYAHSTALDVIFKKNKKVWKHIFSKKYFEPLNVDRISGKSQNLADLLITFL